MNLALFYSFAIHFFLFCLLMFTIASSPIKQKERATYTIDFIGQSAEVMRYGAPEQKQAGNGDGGTQEIKQEQKQEAKTQEPAKEIKTEIKAETKTKAKTQFAVRRC